MGMRTAYLSDRGVPRSVPGGLRAVGIRTIADCCRTLFP
jgi:hypothetical protein